MNILEELWSREKLLKGSENGTEEYSQLVEKVCKCENELCNKLSAEGKEIYEKYEEALSNLRYYTELNNFKMGFRTCIKLMLDTCDDCRL